MEAMFNGLWLIGEAASFMLLIYGGSLVFGYNRRASLGLLAAVAGLAMNESQQRGAALIASKQAATVN